MRDYSALRLNFLCEAGRQGGLVAVEAVEERQAEHEAAQHHEHVVEDEEEKQKRPERWAKLQVLAASDHQPGKSVTWGTTTSTSGNECTEIKQEPDWNSTAAGE